MEQQVHFERDGKRQSAVAAVGPRPGKDEHQSRPELAGQSGSDAVNVVRTMQRLMCGTFGTALLAAVISTGCARPLPSAQRVATTNVAALRTAFGGGRI